jgi:phenylalanyl-tRNA synthetase beta subunit
VHPETVDAYDIPLDMDNTFYPISKYQRIDRELNFVMSETTRTGVIATTISALHPWITGVVVDSIYRDESKV